jgi:hypothetical protein
MITFAIINSITCLSIRRTRLTVYPFLAGIQSNSGASVDLAIYEHEPGSLLCYGLLIL